MSYYSWHNYGYGIQVDDIKINSVENLKKLIALAPKYEKQINEWFADCNITNPTIDDYFDFDQDYNLGLATLLGKVIWEAEEIGFVYCDDYDGNTFLIFAPRYPWNITEKEKNLTEKDVENIIRKYVNILTDQEITIDYQAVENGG